jgi:hypothetical protein
MAIAESNVQNERPRSQYVDFWNEVLVPKFVRVVTKQVEIAGYTNINFEQVDAQVFVGKDLDDAVAFQLAIGPAGEVYREAGNQAEKRHDEIAKGLKTALAPFQKPNGIMMDSSSWKATAKNPG